MTEHAARIAAIAAEYRAAAEQEDRTDEERAHFLALAERNEAEVLRREALVPGRIEAAEEAYADALTTLASSGLKPTLMENLAGQGSSYNAAAEALFWAEHGVSSAFILRGLESGDRVWHRLESTGVTHVSEIVEWDANDGGSLTLANGWTIAVSDVLEAHPHD